MLGFLKLILVYHLIAIRNCQGERKKITVEEAPFVALLNVMMPDNLHYYGCFIIDKDTVIAAARSIPKDRMTEARVIPGVNYWPLSEQDKKLKKYRVKEVTYLPSYDSDKRNILEDIAVVKLNESIEFSSKVNTIELDYMAWPVGVPRYCQVVSFNGQDGLGSLSRGDVCVMSGPYIGKKCTNENFTMDTRGVWSDPVNSANICGSDLGGALICDGKAVGVATYFRRCFGKLFTSDLLFDCDKSGVGVYTTFAQLRPVQDGCSGCSQVWDSRANSIVSPFLLHFFQILILIHFN